MADVDQHRLYGWAFSACGPFMACRGLGAERPLARLLMFVVSVALVVAGVLLFRRSRRARAVALGTTASLAAYILIAPAALGEPYGLSQAAFAFLCCWTFHDLMTMPVTVSEATAALRKAQRAAAMAVHGRDQAAAAARDAAASLERASTSSHDAAGHEASWATCTSSSCLDDRRAVEEARALIGDMTRDLA